MLLNWFCHDSKSLIVRINCQPVLLWCWPQCVTAAPCVCLSMNIRVQLLLYSVGWLYSLLNVLSLVCNVPSWIHGNTACLHSSPPPPDWWWRIARKHWNGLQLMTIFVYYFKTQSVMCQNGCFKRTPPLNPLLKSVSFPGGPTENDVLLQGRGAWL